MTTSNWDFVRNYSNHTIRLSDGTLQAGWLVSQPSEEEQKDIAKAIAKTWKEHYLDKPNKDFQPHKEARSFRKGCERIKDAYPAITYYQLHSRVRDLLDNEAGSDRYREELVYSIRPDSTFFLTNSLFRLRPTMDYKKASLNQHFVAGCLTAYYANTLPTRSPEQKKLVNHLRQNVLPYALKHDLKTLHKEVSEYCDFYQAIEEQIEKIKALPKSNLSLAEMTLEAWRLREWKTPETENRCYKLDTMRKELADGLLTDLKTKSKADLPGVIAAASLTTPLKKLETDLEIILNYTRTYKQCLTVDNGKLAYTYSSTIPEEEVGKAIAAMADQLTQAWEAGIDTRANLMGTSLRFMDALVNLKLDYVKYPILLSKLNDIEKTFKKNILIGISPENTEIPVNPAPFDLVELKLEQYPFPIVQEALHHHYGEDFAQRLIDFYLPANCETVSYSQLRGLILSAAVDVKETDLGQRPVAHFRNTPTGGSWLEYFKIPLSANKASVDASFWKVCPYVTVEDKRAAIGMQVLADIESCQIWQDPFRVRMDKKTIVEKLTYLSQYPTYNTLFNNDPYLHFLEVAALGLAVRKEMPELLPLMKHCVAYADNTSDKPTETYWRQLLTCLMNPAVDAEESFRSLLRHPHQADMLPTASEVVEDLQASEFLARKVAYWNKYVLEESAFLDANGNIVDPKVRQLREGTIFTLITHNVPETYVVKKAIILDEGLVCQVCAPLDTAPYAGKPIPLKLTFMGTIGHKTVILRDKEAIGPGNALWEAKGYAVYGPALEEVMAQYPDSAFALEITGHSLGGADTQNAAVALVRERQKENPKLQNMVSHRIVTFNTAGITKESAKAFDDFMNAHPELLEKVCHSLVKFDVVGESGQTKVGGALTDKKKIWVVEIRNHCENASHNNIMLKHCDLVYATGEKITLTRVLHHEKNKELYQGYFVGVGANLYAISENSFFLTAHKVLDQHTYAAVGRDLGLSVVNTGMSIVCEATKDYFVQGKESSYLLGFAHNMFKERLEKSAKEYKDASGATLASAAKRAFRGDKLILVEDH